MNGLTRYEGSRWDPFRELEEISERFGRIMGQLPARRGAGDARDTMTVADWIPTVDVAEDDKEYLIKAEVPEVEKKDVKVTVQDGTLTIQGVRRKEFEEKSKRFHRIERAYGTFVRSFLLPENAAEDRLRAEFKDGMLLVHLPKTEKGRSKAVEVRVE